LENFPSVSLISHAEGSGQCRKCFTKKHIPSCTPLQTTWTLEQYQLHIGTCSGCKNSESVIACNFAACSGSLHL